jgi:hypothetical protein
LAFITERLVNCEIGGMLKQRFQRQQRGIAATNLAIMRLNNKKNFFV